MTRRTIRPHPDVLCREVDVFCRYLVGRSPDSAVVKSYQRAHRMGALQLDEQSSRFDELLVRIARVSPWLTRMTDSYATVCSGRKLRSKLVLLLGILENCPAHLNDMNREPRHSRGVFLLLAGSMLVVYFANLLVALLLFLPLRLLCWLRGGQQVNS